jgi:outer membrane protein TolC
MFSFRNRNRVVISILWIVLAPISSFSQIPYLKLADITDSADHYLPRLLEKKALLNSALANITETRHQFLPAVRFNDQVNIASDNSLPGSYLSYGIIPSTSAGVHSTNDLQPASGNIAALYGEYDLIDFGYKRARIDYAKSAAAFQGSDLQREIYVFNGEISRTYFNLLISEVRMSVEQQTVKRYDTIFSTILALTTSGIKPGSDSSLAKAELSKSRLTYNQINEQVINYREQLSYLTGIPVSQLTTDTSILSTQMPRKLFVAQTGSGSNPLIDYYSSLKNTYLVNEKLISKSYLPRIQLNGATWARGSSIDYNSQYQSLETGLGYQRFNYMAGLAFQYDLFNGLHKKDRLKTYGFEREAAENELQQQRFQLENASRQAQNSINISEKNLQELPIQYQAAIDTYNQKMAQYKAGIISLIDLTNAAFVLDRSLNDYVETIGSWYLAQLDMAYSTGNLSSFIQSIQ